jgi:bifunctional non-homologous end joining protein LigD
VRLLTRNGHDWTGCFPLIVEALYALKVTTSLLDGEAVTCSESGLADLCRTSHPAACVARCARRPK